MKIAIIIIGIVTVVFVSFWLDNLARTKSTYEGLPTVACLDYTKPVVEQFSFNIKITINGENYPIERSLGHDFGNCLHDIFANDSSGKIFVKSNDKETFTLGQLFDVWHKTFSKNQISAYQADKNHSINITVNGVPDNSYRNIILMPNEDIEISYK